MTRRTIAEQMTQHKAQQVGVLEVRTRSPDGVRSVRACWGVVTAEQLAAIVAFIEKTTKGNRS